LGKYTHVNSILTTHFIQICKHLENNVSVCNYKMDILEKERKIEYTYQLVPGISTIRGGVKILCDMNYPEEIINNILSQETQ